MAINNTAKLIGFTGNDIKVIDSKEGKTFATFSFATTDSYKIKKQKSGSISRLSGMRSLFSTPK